ncbi:MAG: toxin-antitoxin system HicB family antitoxin [Sandarakinorhabdus sp.]|nr:toxin-antitoxin system HicB family antitoxin [Sandarakinorhabdus sp.]
MHPLSVKAFALHLDPALHAAIERAATADLRSINAEIEVLLRETLSRRGVKVAMTPAAQRGRPSGRRPPAPQQQATPSLQRRER